MKSCIIIWDRSDKNAGFHGNRKRPLTYNGEDDVSTLTPSVFVGSSSNLHACNEDRPKTSDEFEFQPDRTTPFRVR